MNCIVSVGETIILKAKGLTRKGVLTTNPNHKTCPYDEPTKDYDYFTYYIDDVPTVIQNDNHIVEVPAKNKVFSIGKKVYWG